MDAIPPDEPGAPDPEDEGAGLAAPDPDGPEAGAAPEAPYDPLPPFAVPIVWLLGLFLVPFLAMGTMFLAVFGGHGDEPRSNWVPIAATVVWTLVCVRLFFVRRRRARRRADPRRRTPW